MMHEIANQSLLPEQAAQEIGKKMFTKQILMRSRYLIMLLVMLLASLGLSTTTAFAASRNDAGQQRSSVTGTVSITLVNGDNQTPVQLSIQNALTFTNFAGKNFTMTIMDKTTSPATQVLSLQQRTLDDGTNNENVVVTPEETVTTLPNKGWEMTIEANNKTLARKTISVSDDGFSGQATFLTPTTPTRTATGTCSTGICSNNTINVTGSVEVINDTTVFPVSIQLKIPQLAGQQVSVDIVSQSQGQILHRSEQVESPMGIINDDVNLQPFFSFDPNNDWVVQVTDANGDTSSLPMNSTGQVATAFFAATATN
jgi:hypothetical protein